MNDLLIMEAIMINSFLSSFYLFIFPSASEETMYRLFPVYLVITLLAMLIQKGKSEGYRSLIPMSSLLMIFIYGPWLFHVISSLVLCFYMYFIYEKTKRESYASGIKTTYILIFIFILISSSNKATDDSIRVFTPFYIIYLVFSILFLRTKRHYLSDLPLNKIRKQNAVYLILFFITYLIVGNKKLVEQIKNLAERLFVLATNPLNKILNKMFEAIPKDVKVKTPYNAVTSTIPDLSTYTTSMHTDHAPIEVDVGKFINRVLILTMLLVILLFLVYFIYRIVMKGKGYKNSQNETEIREELDGKKKKKGFFFREKYPKNNDERIRYWYRRYIENLDHKEIVAANMTSCDVRDVSKLYLDPSKTDPQTLDIVRNSYIRSRYGSEEVSSEDVSSMQKNVKAIKYQ